MEEEEEVFHLNLQYYVVISLINKSVSFYSKTKL